jgi:hypothetical protein
VRADPEFQGAVRREAGLALLVSRHEGNAPGSVDAGAVAGLLGVHGKADPDAAAVGLGRALAAAHLVEADGGDGAAQRLGVVAGVEVPLGDVVEGHLLRAHEALEAQVVRLGPELAGERVEGHFESEADAGARNAAVGEDRRLVGRDRVGAATVVREIIKPGQDGADLAGFETGGERIGGVT